MKLATVRQTVKGLYGREYSTAADDLFTDTLLNELINEWHRDLAEIARPYERTRTYDVPQGALGISTVALDCDVIDLNRNLVRILSNALWTQPLVGFLSEEELIGEYGILDNTTLAVAGAHSFFLQLGTVFGANRNLILYPGYTAAVTAGVRVREVIYPALMSDDNHVPALQPAEHRKLLNGTMWKMAQIEADERGLDSSVVQRLGVLAMRDANDLKMTIETFKAGGPW